MGNKLFVLLLLISVVGCKHSSNVTGPVTTLPTSVSDTLDGILFTFSVSKEAMGVQDTLNASLIAFNQTAVPETLWVGVENPEFFTWSIRNESGRIVMSGPNPATGTRYPVTVNPYQSVKLYGLSVNYFGAIFDAGSYLLQWYLTPLTFPHSRAGDTGLDFEISLIANKSGQVTDPSGVISPIYPLKIGNEWTFEEILMSSSGTVLGTDTVTARIATEVLIGGEKWFLLTSSAETDQFLTSRQDGIYQYFPETKTTALKFKYPANIGDQYASGYEEWNGTTADTVVSFTATVDSIQEPIHGPAGTYQCNKYHYPEILATFGSVTNEVDPEDFYLTTVGPDRRTFYSGNGIVVSYWVLLSTNF